MPEYTYRCKHCDNEFERYVSPVPPFEKINCPQCGDCDLEEEEVEYFEWEDRYQSGGC